MGLLRSNSITPLFTCLVICLLVSPAQAKYSGVGNGDPNNPYRIADANDMNEIGTHPEDFSAHFILVNDINLADYTGTQFNIIGPNYTTPFTGVFDGNGHTISNFNYQTSGNYIGLFGGVDGANAEIKDLTLINPNVHGNGYVGSLVGGLSIGTITNCNTEGADISGDSFFVGGLVGINADTILNCYATGTVDGNSISGGLVGGNIVDGEILNCYATANVNGNDSVGGLVGFIHHFMYTPPRIIGCYATGNVSGNNYTGGLIGRFDAGAGAIVNCYATGTVDGNDCTGGLVGFMSIVEGGMVNCYAAGAVIGNDPNIGGLVGYDAVSWKRRKCFWDSDVNPDVNGIGNKTDPNIIGKTTMEMQTESTFTDADWDFIEIWNIGENQTYPYLRVYTAGNLNHDGHVNWLDFAIFTNHWLAGAE
ncbi:MAG: GLUG motif-containing protein [Planctomycetota bacterium]|jgi:hypothetical protein